MLFAYLESTTDQSTGMLCVATYSSRDDLCMLCHPLSCNLYDFIVPSRARWLTHCLLHESSFATSPVVKCSFILLGYHGNNRKSILCETIT